MNFLALVNRARRECGRTGSALTTLQTGLSEESQRFVDWVGQAWIDVQMRRPDWLWMRKKVAFDTIAAQSIYTPLQAGAANVNEWQNESFRQYLLSAGVGSEQYMNYVEWDDFRDVYLFGSVQNSSSIPMMMTVTPEQNLQMWPIPNGVYRIQGEYHRAPTSLVLDADDPSSSGNDLPERFHMLMVFKAMQSYAAYEAAPEVMDRGMREAKRLMTQLENYGLPKAYFP
jgi:hypothetical protein